MGEKIISHNKKAFFNYEILQTWEAGIVLNGPEIKSIRAREVSINEAFIIIRNQEAFILNMHIKKYEYANYVLGLEETRTRKLLLKKTEIQKLSSEVQKKHLTIVPLKLYFKNNYVKLEIGLGRGKKLYDKREAIKKREFERRSKQNKY